MTLSQTCLRATTAQAQDAICLAKSIAAKNIGGVRLQKFRLKASRCIAEWRMRTTNHKTSQKISNRHIAVVNAMKREEAATLSSVVELQEALNTALLHSEALGSQLDMERQKRAESETKAVKLSEELIAARASQNALAQERDSALAELADAAKERDVVMKLQDAAMKETDAALRETEAAIKEKERALREREEAETQRDMALDSHNCAVEERAQAKRDQAAAEEARDQALKDKESAYKERQAAVRERDAAYAGKDAAVEARDRCYRLQEQAERERDECMRERDILVREKEAADRETTLAAKERDSADERHHMRLEEIRALHLDELEAQQLRVGKLTEEAKEARNRAAVAEKMAQEAQESLVAQESLAESHSARADQLQLRLQTMETEAAQLEDTISQLKEAAFNRETKHAKLIEASNDTQACLQETQTRLKEAEGKLQLMEQAVHTTQATMERRFSALEEKAVTSFTDFEAAAVVQLDAMRLSAGEKEEHLREVERQMGMLSEQALSAEHHASMAATLEMQVSALQAEVHLHEPLKSKLSDIQEELDRVKTCCTRAEEEKSKAVDDLDCILQALAQLDCPDELSQNEHKPDTPIPDEPNLKLLWGLHRLESAGRLMQSVIVQCKKQAAALSSQHKVLRNLGRAQKQTEQQIRAKNNTLNGLIAVMEGTREQAGEGEQCLRRLLDDTAQAYDSVRSFSPDKSLGKAELDPPKLPPLRQHSLKSHEQSRICEESVENGPGWAHERLARVLAAVSSLDPCGIDIDPNDHSCAEAAVRVLKSFSMRESEARDARAFAESAIKGLQEDKHQGSQSTKEVSSQLASCQAELASCQSQLESYKVTLECLQVKHNAAMAAQSQAESSMEQTQQQQADHDQDVLWLEEQIDQKEAELQHQRDEFTAQTSELVKSQDQVVMLKAEAASLSAQLQCLQSQRLVGPQSHNADDKTLGVAYEMMTANVSSASDEKCSRHELKPSTVNPEPGADPRTKKKPRETLVAQMRLELECEHQKEVAAEAAEALGQREEEVKDLESRLAARDECIEELLAQYDDERRGRLELEQRLGDLNKELNAVQSAAATATTGVQELAQANEREAKLRADKQRVESALAECQSCLERLLAGSVGSSQEERERREKAEAMLEEERGFFVSTLEKMERELLKMQEDAIRQNQQQGQPGTPGVQFWGEQPQAGVGSLHGFTLMGGHPMPGLQ